MRGLFVITGLLLLWLCAGCGSASTPSIEAAEASSAKTRTSTTVSTGSPSSAPVARPSRKRGSVLAHGKIGASSASEPEQADSEETEAEAEAEDALALDCIEAPSQWVCDVEKEIAAMVAAERQDAGLNALALDAKISYAARLWSTEQAKSGQISHDWFESGELKSAYLEKFGELPRLVSENVAMVPCAQEARQTARLFMVGWMNSPGHRANILRRGDTTIGVGVAVAAGYCFGTQDFGH